ncbi:hypothetical protein [Clostridium sp.]|uniref:hypothetical protein n=1 Tax=Clostridium sp. TaxID=1506 RepID=UPI003993AC3B
MKNKKGFVTISLVLWLTLILSVVTSLYISTLRESSILRRGDKLKNYKKNYAYYDVVKEFERTINEKLLGEELDFKSVVNESYFLESSSKIYEMKYNDKSALFLLKVINKSTNEKTEVYYKELLKENGTIFFERRTSNVKKT